MEKSSLEVSILGSSFSIQSGNDPLYLGKVVDYLNVKIDEVQKGFTVRDPMKISLLAALNIIDELFQAKGTGGEKDSVEITQITNKLIHRIDESLSENY